MKTILKYPLVLLFSLFILLFTVVDLIKPDKVFSEMENKELTSRPKFSISALLDNSFSQKYEKYINDQFVGRDTWISLKSISEVSIGKIENNGIVFGKHDYMFEKYKTVDKQFDRNKQFIIEFIEMYPDLPITFSIIPNSYMILDDYVPKGLNNVDQKKLTEEFYQALDYSNVKTIDFYDALSKEKDKYIYYRTDHHWTSYGAYLAYGKYIQSIGKTPADLYELNQNEVNDFYGTYYSKAKLYNAVPDVITYYDTPTSQVLIDEEVVDGIYDYEKFAERDKYASFMRGNNGLTVIKSNVNQDKVAGKTSKIFVIKDSYANSFIPYLVYNFDEIYVADLRYLVSGGVSKLISEQDFDDVLVMYNFMTFENEKNIAKLRY